MAEDGGAETPRLARGSQEFGAGAFLLAIGAIGFWQSLSLDTGTLNQLGPGMLPRALAVIVGLCGVALIVEGIVSRGARLARWSIRGPLFILGAVVVFALCVRPLGLAVAGPLAIFVSGFASPETRWPETIAFGLVMTAFCIALFKLALGLPIPVAPWLVGW